MAARTNRAAIRGDKLVQELLQFSRERAREFEVLNVAIVLRETYALITQSFDKKINLRIDVADPLLIRGDHSGLSQVFMNLCTNARDAMPEGGELSIEARGEERNALIIVSDTGQGMNEETQERCFDPFFTTKEVDKGTGLGLSTTYGIVKDHGGEIHVFSELNEGTTFKLYFPVASSDEYPEQAGRREVVRGNGEKVLIVDDEKDVLESVEMLIEWLGYRTASVNNAKAAIEKYRSWGPDVVLLDRNMPEMDGITCAKRILENDRGAKIVVVSGYEEKGPSGIDGEIGALIRGYLTKPMDIEVVSQLLGRLFHDGGNHE